MMRTLPARLLGLTLAAAVAGTTGSIAGCGGPSGNSASTINDFQAGVFRASCDWQQRCGGIGASELVRCYDNFNLISEGPVDFAALVDGRRIAFDSGAASRCLDALQGASCRSFFGTSDLPDCVAAATGLIQPGDACTTDLECAGGYCSASQQGCAGKCVAFPAIGAACTSIKGCGPTASCDALAHTCKARQAAGGACTSISDCQRGLRCAADAMGGASKCAAFGTAGAPCTAVAGACADGFYCDGSSKTCKPQQERGAACAGLGECKSGLGCLGLNPQQPGTMGTCGAFLDAGSTCVPDTVGCPSDMTCDAAMKKCLARGAVGTSCVADSSCVLGTYCDGTSHKCQDFVAYGAVCTPALGGTTDPCAIGECEASSKKCLVLCP